FFLFILLPLLSTLFPYTTLFRSMFDLTAQVHIEMAHTHVDFHAAQLQAGEIEPRPSSAEVDRQIHGHFIVELQIHFGAGGARLRSEEHTSELQSRGQLVCRLLLE